MSETKHTAATPEAAASMMIACLAAPPPIDPTFIAQCRSRLIAAFRAEAACAAMKEALKAHPFPPTDGKSWESLMGYLAAVEDWRATAALPALALAEGGGE